ncbi:MAG TPA: helix-turn-helix domain-containing protein [Propionicimonas sp.]|nr:helix-turn-helix domain-containing protein [Propionicimonas sp.]
MPAVGGNSHVMTSERDSKLARAVLEDLEGATNALVVEQNGQRRVAVPPEVGQVLQQVLSAMASGRSVTVNSFSEELTTSIAAQILGVSRPTVMKMINSGQLPSHRVGSHHRLSAEDVFAELQARRERERAAFSELLELEDDEF